MIEVEVDAAVNLTNKVDELNKRLAKLEHDQPRTLKVPVGLSGTQSSVVVGGPSQGRQWQIRRVQLDAPAASSTASLFGSGTVTNPAFNVGVASIGAANFTSGGFYTVTVTNGYGTTPGTIFGNVRLQVGSTTIVSGLGPVLNAQASQTVTIPNVYIPANTTLRTSTAAADSAGGAIYESSILAVPAGVGGIVMYSDESLSQASLLWEFASSPVSETFGRDEMTLVFPEVLVIDTLQAGSALAGSVQVIDMPVGEYVR